MELKLHRGFPEILGSGYCDAWGFGNSYGRGTGQCFPDGTGLSNHTYGKVLARGEGTPMGPGFGNGTYLGSVTDRGVGIG